MIWAGKYFKICERLDDGLSPTVNNKTIKASYNYPYIESDIVLTQDEFCPNKIGDCHIYIEHLNLTKTNLYVENDKRPVVLHLVTPKEGQTNQRGSKGLFNLSSNALLCGVNQGKKTCNQKPERLIIVSDHDIKSPNKDTSCSSKSYPLKIAGSSLPHAFLMLRKGSVELTANTSLNGAIWSHNICANNNDLRVTIPIQIHGKNV